MQATRVNRDAAVAALCPKCGFCCDGTIFTNVKVTSAATARKLAELGIRLPKKLPCNLAQPCPAFDGKLCRIYKDRPDTCQKFECRLVERVATGTITAEHAQRQIREAKTLIRKVESFLPRFVASRPLSHKFSDAMAEPIDLAAGNATDHLAGLAEAVEKLAQKMRREFLG